MAYVNADERPQSCTPRKHFIFFILSLFTLSLSLNAHNFHMSCILHAVMHLTDMTDGIRHAWQGVFVLQCHPVGCRPMGDGTDCSDIVEGMYLKKYVFCTVVSSI